MKYLIIIATVLFIFGLSCTGIAVTTIPDSTKNLTEFYFDKTTNSLDYTIYGEINGTNITLSVPYNATVTNLAPTLSFTGQSISPGNGEYQDFSNPVTYTITAEDKTTTTYTVTVTVEKYYQRSPDVIKDSYGNYWLIYAQADNTTVLSENTDDSTWHTLADGDTYSLYYKKANSLDKVLGSMAHRIDVSYTNRPSNFQQRELGVALLNGAIYVFASNGSTSNSVWYYKTSDSGATWEGPTEILSGKGFLHVHAQSGDIGNGEKIYISGGMSGQGAIYEFDGSVISATSWIDNTADILAQGSIINGSLYLVARTGTAVTIWENNNLDPTTDAYYTVDASVSASTWDHSMCKIGSTWYVFAAPDDGTKQYIDLYTSSSLSGSWTKQTITNPGANMWDYWPAPFVEDNTGILFYASEKNGYGHIATYQFCP